MEAVNDIRREQLLNFFEAMPFMAWYKDKEGRFLYVNQLFAEGCGKSKAQIIGHTDFDVWPEALAAAYRADDLLVMSTGKEKLIEESIDDKRGGKWFETYKAPIYDDEGNLVGTIGTAKDITLWKIYQNELKNQKQIIRSMIDAIPDLIFFKDLKGVYLGCNEAFAHLLMGLDEEAIIGKTDEALLKDPEMVRLFTERDQAVICNGKKTVKEEVVQFANGEHIHLETLQTLFYDDQGKASGIIGIARDITERKHIEIQLKESELRLNLATGNTQIGLWDWQVQTGETIFNEQWADIVGYSIEALERLSIDTWVKLTHPDDLERSNSLLQAHFEGKTELYECEVRMRHKDNRWIWVLDRGKVTEWDSDHKPVRMLGTHIDIDRQKQTENMLRRQEQILSAVALSIKELIVNRDYMSAIDKCFQLIGEAALVDRVYLFTNQYDLEGNGFTSQCIEWNSGTSQAQINNPELQMLPFEVLGSFVETLIKGDAFFGIVSQMTNDYAKTLLEAQGIRSIIILPIIVRGVFWGFIGFDECKYDREWEPSEFSILTAFSHSVEKSVERSLVEEELQLAKRNAEAANTLKSQFVANISHEIRTPIHAILGYASLIKEHASDTQCVGYLDAIQKAGDTLMGLLNDILDLSKIEAGRLELQPAYCSLGTLIRDVEQVFYLKVLEKNLEFLVQMDQMIPEEVLMDEVRIRQILLNLIGNSVKFTHQGSIKIQVMVEALHREAEQVDLAFIIEDTGIGIPDDQKTLIFEPFKQKDGQSNKKYGGTGLGLSITQRLVEMMDGHIELESQTGLGTKFIIHLSHISYRGEVDVSSEFSSQRYFTKRLSATNLTEIVQHETAPHVISAEMFKALQDLERTYWQECLESNRVSDMKIFANGLTAIGVQFDSPVVIAYSQQLQAAISAYNLKRVKELLQNFPTWLSNLS